MEKDIQEINKDDYIITFESTGKYWVGNIDGCLDNYRALINQLTDEESRIYNRGKNVKFGFDVVEFGYAVYTHKETNQIIKLPQMLA